MIMPQIYHFPSNCEKILKLSYFTLENLLDEDEVVIDVKEGKAVVINYLLQPGNMKSLINYLVQVPEPDATESVKFRYPAVVFEILTSDIEEMDAAILLNPSYLELIVGFFEKDHQTTLSQRITLVSRFIIYLFKIDADRMTRFITKRDNLVPFLISNINIAGIVTFITAMISEEEYIASWIINAKFIPRLIENFSPHERKDQSRHSFTCTAILEILEVVPGKSRFVIEMNSKDIVDYLTSFMFLPNNDSALLRGLFIFQKLLQIKNAERQIYGVKKEATPVCLVVLDHLSDFHKILGHTLEKNVRGEEPFGPTRMAILKVLKTLVDANFPKVQEKILTSDIFSLALNLFPKFPKNNIFHATTATLVCASLQQRNAHEIRSFLSSSKLVEFIMSMEQEPSCSQFKRWFHLICRVIIDRAKRYMEVQEFLEKIVGWLDYSSMVLTEKVKDDLFDRDKLRENSYPREETALYKDDDVGISLDHSVMSLDVDIDSKTDTDELELNDTEMCVSKFEIETFGLRVEPIDQTS